MNKDTNAKKAGSEEARQTFAFYVGIDLGDKNSDVCVLDPSGEVSKQFRLPMKEAGCGHISQASDDKYAHH
jgi:hypothetical protein